MEPPRHKAAVGREMDYQNDAPIPPLSDQQAAWALRFSSVGSYDVVLFTSLEGQNL